MPFIVCQTFFGFFEKNLFFYSAAFLGFGMQFYPENSNLGAVFT